LDIFETQATPEKAENEYLSVFHHLASLIAKNFASLESFRTLLLYLLIQLAKKNTVAVSAPHRFFSYL